jgi:hypothetical protein
MRSKSLPLSVRAGARERALTPPSPRGPRVPKPRRKRDWLATIPMIILPVVMILPLIAVEAAGPRLDTAGVIRAGAEIRIDGSGFQSQHVQLTWNGSPDGLPRLRVKGGAFSASLVVPSDAVPGEHVLGAADQRGNGRRVDDSALSIVASLVVEVVAPVALVPTPSPSDATDDTVVIDPSADPSIELPPSVSPGEPSPTPDAAPTDAPAQAGPNPTAAPPAPSTPAPTRAPAPAPPISASAGILTTAAEVASLPTSGAAWNALTATAAGDWGPANVSDKNNRHGVHALSGALVYARTGDAAYRAKVIAAIEAAMAAGWSVSNGTELGVSRNLGAYAMAADLVGYRSAGFEGWLRTLLTAKVDTHSIWNVVREVSEISANNHGTFALASRTAVAIYLGDRADLDRAWAIFRGYADGSWSRFKPTADYDPAWQCGSTYIPINPACSKDGRNLDGAPVDDAARSSYPTPDGGYINEAMQGYALMGVLFSRQGYPAWSTGDNAILRVAQFQQRHGIWNYHSTGYHTGWVINHFYGANLPLAAAVPGRLLGYTDWLYGN